MTALHSGSVQRWLRGHLLCHVDDAGPYFGLTFDDGPGRRDTPALLDTLARHDARATFFLMRSRIVANAGLCRRMRAEGHELGIHGDWHLPAYLMPRIWLEREIDRTASALRDVAGVAPRYYRAPFGLLFPRHARAVRARGLTPVLGDIYPRDHAERSPEPIVTHVMRRLDRGSIVILHDSSALGNGDRRATVAAVEQILVAAAERGLSSRTVDELNRGVGGAGSARGRNDG